MEEREDNDLVVPLSFNNQFAHFIFRNKAINKVAYNPVILCFLAAALLMLAVAIYMMVAMAAVQQLTFNYYSPGSSSCANATCTVSFSIPATMKAPVYLLYRLDDFFQNHRRYIQSKSNAQLLGRTISASDAELCTPYITNSDMKVTKSWGGATLNPNAIASPCGAIAYTFYNDTFALASSTASIPIQETGITWPHDVGGKYKRAPDSSQTQWIDPENEHFVSWMRTAGLPNFSKVWGRIEQSLSPGQYTMTIANNFSLKEWSGNKYFILTTDSSAGGRNFLLPIELLLGSVASFIAVVYLRRLSLQYRKAVIE